MIPAVIDLGGPCELRECTITRKGGRQNFHKVDIIFSNGKEIEELPTYVARSEPKDKALEIARNAGNKAAASGILDVYALIQDGTLPVVDYMLKRVAEERKALGEQNVNYIYVSSSDSSGFSTLRIEFNNQHGMTGGLATRLPYSKDGVSVVKKEILDRLTQIYGGEYVISGPTLKINRRLVDPNESITEFPNHGYLGENNGTWNYEIGENTKSSRRTISLGHHPTKESAQEQADHVLDYAAILLQGQEYFTQRELSEYAQSLREGASAPDHKKYHRLGPVVIRAPDFSGCKSYLAWMNNNLAMIFMDLNGKANETETHWGKISATILGLASDQRDQLKEHLWSFVHDRLAEKLINEGYRFRVAVVNPENRTLDEVEDRLRGMVRVESPNQADLLLTFAPNGTLGFTEQGHRRIREDILQGRMEFGFIRAAMEAGYDNPFDIRIPVEEVQRLRRVGRENHTANGNGNSYPQPEHPWLRFENIEKIGQGTRLTVVFGGSKDEGFLGQGFRETVTVEDIGALADRINQLAPREEGNANNLKPGIVPRLKIALRTHNCARQSRA